MYLLISILHFAILPLFRSHFARAHLAWGATGSVGQTAGTVSSDGSTVTYGTGSDYRVKENIVPMSVSGLTVINNLRPKQFNFVSNPDKTVNGFVAHELQEHVPLAVVGEKDATRAIGNIVKIDEESVVRESVPEPEELEAGTEWIKTGDEPVYQNVDLSKLVPYLVKAIQELSARVEALEK